MGAMPGNIETDQQPPMTIPLRHFVVGLGFLLGGTLVGIGISTDIVPGLRTLAHVHLLLVGWICITIMGAMTQFVPVWSGATLYSRKLASLQLTLVTVGLLGFGTALVFNTLVWLILFGGFMLIGFWTFVYNIARTLVSLESFGVTERHFLLSLGFFAVLTVLGFLLAVDFTRPLFAETVITRSNVVATHATIAVFGAVLTTVYGALYQLGTMFTQTELHGIDEYLQPIEEIGHPVGVVLLAIGRGLDTVLVAQIGGMFVLGAALAFSAVLGRKLYEMQVAWTPMHTRYSIAAPGLSVWALVTIPAWLRAPTASEHLFGAAGSVHLLVFGTIGFVVLGTLYHIIPFIIWVHRYSDLLGYEDVPMIDDLYDARLAALDATLLVSGTVALVASDWFNLPPMVQISSGGLIGLGIITFGANMILVIYKHSPHTLGRILFGSLDPRQRPTAEDYPAKE